MDWYNWFRSFLCARHSAYFFDTPLPRRSKSTRRCDNPSKIQTFNCRAFRGRFNQSIPVLSSPPPRYPLRIDIVSTIHISYSFQKVKAVRSCLNVDGYEQDFTHAAISVDCFLNLWHYRFDSVSVNCLSTNTTENDVCANRCYRQSSSMCCRSIFVRKGIVTSGLWTHNNEYMKSQTTVQSRRPGRLWFENARPHRGECWTFG